MRQRSVSEASMVSNSSAFEDFPDDVNEYYSDDDYYDEYHKVYQKNSLAGIAIIIGNSNYQSYSGCSRLEGVPKDVKKMMKVFRNANLTGVALEDVTANEIKKISASTKFKEECKRSACNCFLFYFSGHGADDRIFGIDGYPVLIGQEIIKSICELPEFLGKPKIFLFDSCRGHEKDVAINVKGIQTLLPDLFSSFFQSKGAPSVKVAEVYVACATPQKFVSWDTAQGGLWTHELYRQLSRKIILRLAREKTSLNNILVRVRAEMRKKCTVKQAQISEDAKVTMTKHLYWKDFYVEPPPQPAQRDRNAGSVKHLSAKGSNESLSRTGIMPYVFLMLCILGVLYIFSKL